MLGKDKNPYLKNLAVEVSVSLYNVLETDEEQTVYEYMGEAEQIVDSVGKNPNSTVDEIASLTALVLSQSLEHEYDAEGFTPVAEFIHKRLQHFKDHSLL